MLYTFFLLFHPNKTKAHGSHSSYLFSWFGYIHSYSVLSLSLASLLFFLLPQWILVMCCCVHGAHTMYSTVMRRYRYRKWRTWTSFPSHFPHRLLQKWEHVPYSYFGIYLFYLPQNFFSLLLFATLTPSSHIHILPVHLPKIPYK